MVKARKLGSFTECLFPLVHSKQFWKWMWDCRMRDASSGRVCYKGIPGPVIIQCSGWVGGKYTIVNYVFPGLILTQVLGYTTQEFIHKRTRNRDKHSTKQRSLGFRRKKVIVTVLVNTILSYCRQERVLMIRKYIIGGRVGAGKGVRVTISFLSISKPDTVL